MKTTKILFIHHSTGGNLVAEGQLRQKLQKINQNIEFWDHSYNLSKLFPLFIAKFTHKKGLSNPSGQITGHDYNIVLSNNSPKEYAEIFSRSPNDPTLKAILQYDIIAFKNCYPTTKITSDKQLDEDKKYYKTIRDSIKTYTKNKFILVTSPPLRKEMTQPEYAYRAKNLTSLLTSDAFIKSTKNLFIFDFFNLLGDEQGFLKRKYTRLSPLDSHPNTLANKEIALIFVQYIQKVAKN